MNPWNRRRGDGLLLDDLCAFVGVESLGEFALSAGAVDAPVLSLLSPIVLAISGVLLRLLPAVEHAARGAPVRDEDAELLERSVRGGLAVRPDRTVAIVHEVVILVLALVEVVLLPLEEEDRVPGHLAVRRLGSRHFVCSRSRVKLVAELGLEPRILDVMSVPSLPRLVPATRTESV